MGLHFSPSAQQLNLGEPLREYVNANFTGFIGLDVLAPRSVKVKNGKFAKTTREDMLTVDEVARAPKTNFNRGDVNMQEDSFNCTEKAFEIPVDETDLQNAASHFDAVFEASTTAAHKVMRSQENAIASAVFNTSTWTGSDLYTDISTVWSDVSSDVIGDVEAAKNKVRANSGMMPNCLILNHVNLGYLKKNTALRNSITYSTIPSDELMIQYLSDILGLRIIVARELKNSANEGQDFSSSEIWSSSYAMVARIANAESPITEPCVGRCFQWNQGSGPYITEQYPEQNKDALIVRVRQWTDNKILMPEMGHLLKID